MDRLQPLRAFGSDRGVPPVEVRRREVSGGFGAREGENKGETKGKEKSCTEQENKNENKTQNTKTSFHDPDATNCAGGGESEANSVTRAKKHSNEAFKAAEATNSNAEKERRLETIESADLSEAAAAATGRSFSTQTPFGQPNPCSEIAEAVENNKGEQPPSSDELAETKRMLTEFSMTLSMARGEFFDRAVANVNSSFARQTDRYLRTVAGKNAKKRAATLLKNFCDELVAKRLAERKAKQEGLAEERGSSADPDPDHDTTTEDDPAEYYGDAADPESFEEEWCD